MPFTSSGLWIPRELPPPKQRWPHISISIVISVCGFLLAAASFWITQSNTYWSQRAYLSVLASHALSHADMDKLNSFEILLSNSGGTPAFIDQDSLHLFVLNDIDKLPRPLGRFKDGSAIEDNGPHGLALEVASKGNGTLRTLMFSCFDNVAVEKKAVFADLRYRDFINRMHHIRWGWVTDVDDTGGTVLGDDPLVGEYKTTPIDDDVVQEVFKSIHFK